MSETQWRFLVRRDGNPQPLASFCQNKLVHLISAIPRYVKQSCTYLYCILWVRLSESETFLHLVFVRLCIKDLFYHYYYSGMLKASFRFQT